MCLVFLIILLIDHLSIHDLIEKENSVGGVVPPVGGAAGGPLLLGGVVTLIVVKKRGVSLPPE